ncbi:MAG TPA: hypothetical protein VFC67_09165 [Prolixibacteraceae bacterium]|nr:hypothetical protein [Prolixibacteraceae bacterium]
MADNTNLSLTVDAWAKIVIERWENKIVRLRIHNTGNLAKSFAIHVFTQSNGDPDKIEFAFNYYGKFSDMGVGTGITAGEAGSGNRKKKPWYSKVFFGQVKQLGVILRSKYEYKAQLTIITNITTNGTN